MLLVKSSGKNCRFEAIERGVWLTVIGVLFDFRTSREEKHRGVGFGELSLKQTELLLPS